MASTFDALFLSKPAAIDRPPNPILMCPFCDATFNNDTIWRTHAGEHFFNNARPVFPCQLCHVHFTNAKQLRHHSAQHTINQSTQTDMEVSSPTNINIKNEVPDESDNDMLDHFNDFKDDVDHFINSEVKLETSVRPTIQEQMLAMKTANVVLERLETDFVQDYKQNVKKRKRRSKARAIKAKFTFPSAPVNCALCSEIISDLFPTADEIADEFKRTIQVECRLCGLGIKQLASVPLHYSRMHIDENGKLTSLAACNACVAQKLAQQKLPIENTDSTWIKCDLCPKLNRNQASYRSHLRNSHKDRCVYLCAHCGHLIIGRARYSKHVYTSHSQYKRPQSDSEYQCDHCGKVFQARGSMIAHLHAHFSQQRFQCTLCPTVLKTAGNLVQHMRNHAGRKNITCDVCGRGFARKANWRFHMRSHTGEQPFSCQECGRRFSAKSNMLAHMRTHTGEKPFACKQCDKRYREVSDLRRHKRIHGGVEKTHICTLCDKRYYEAKCLRGHLMSAHNIVVAKSNPEW